VQLTTAEQIAAVWVSPTVGRASLVFARATGDIQSMTAGSGIIYQESSKVTRVGRMHGFQLWANKPAALKMTSPRYQEVKATDVPEITDGDGTHVRLVCGHFWRKTERSPLTSHFQRPLTARLTTHRAMRPEATAEEPGTAGRSSTGQGRVPDQSRCAFNGPLLPDMTRTRAGKCRMASPRRFR